MWFLLTNHWKPVIEKEGTVLPSHVQRKEIQMASCSCTEPDNQGPPATWPMSVAGERDIRDDPPSGLNHGWRWTPRYLTLYLLDNSLIKKTTSAANKKKTKGQWSRRVTLEMYKLLGTLPWKSSFFIVPWLFFSWSTNCMEEHGTSSCQCPALSRCKWGYDITRSVVRGTQRRRGKSFLAFI